MSVKKEDRDYSVNNIGNKLYPTKGWSGLGDDERHTREWKIANEYGDIFLPYTVNSSIYARPLKNNKFNLSDLPENFPEEIKDRILKEII